jgi:hypothetical protein
MIDGVDFLLFSIVSCLSCITVPKSTLYLRPVHMLEVYFYGIDKQNCFFSHSTR